MNDWRVARIADQVGELTRPYVRTTASYRWSRSRHRVWTTWRVEVPSLLDQMAEAAAYDHRGELVSAGRHVRPGSTVSPVLVALEGIRQGAKDWVVELGSPPGDLVADLRVLAGVAPVLDRAALERLAADVAAWHRIAETMSGW